MARKSLDGKRRLTPKETEHLLFSCCCGCGGAYSTSQLRKPTDIAPVQRKQISSFPLDFPVNLSTALHCAVGGLVTEHMDGEKGIGGFGPLA